MVYKLKVDAGDISFFSYYLLNRLVNTFDVFKLSYGMEFSDEEFLDISNLHSMKFLRDGVSELTRKGYLMYSKQENGKNVYRLTSHAIRSVSLAA